MLLDTLNQSIRGSQTGSFRRELEWVYKHSLLRWFARTIHRLMMRKENLIQDGHIITVFVKAYALTVDPMAI